MWSFSTPFRGTRGLYDIGPVYSPRESLRNVIIGMCNGFRAFKACCSPVFCVCFEVGISGLLSPCCTHYHGCLAQLSRRHRLRGRC